MTTITAESRLSLPLTLILLPAFNEREAIADVIREVRAVCNFPIIVIDDASTDDTIEQAKRAGATIIPLPAQLGAWGATQTGLRHALRHGYEVVVTMDADGQHEARSIQDLVRPVAQGTADVSIGACTERGSFLRRVSWIMMKKVSGLRLEDVTSGFRVYNRNAVQILGGWQATLLDYQDIGVLLLLQSRGIKIVDVNVPMRPRKNGKSRVFSSWLIVGFYMCYTLILGLSKRRLASRYHNPRTVS